MKKQQLMRILIVCMFCIMICPSGNVFAEHREPEQNLEYLRIGTMDLPPYGSMDVETQQKHGIVYELNQEIGRRSGLPFTNIILPFKRMLYLLEKGDIDLISSQAHQAALDAGDRLAVQFKINVISATKKGSGIRKIEDLKGKKMVYHHSATYRKLEGIPRGVHRVKTYQQILTQKKVK